MKKRILVSLMVLVMGLTAQAGIFDNLFGGGKDKKDDGKIKIGFLLKTMQEERYQKDKKYFMEAAYAAGADEVVFDSANNKEQTQLSKFETMLARGVDVIVLQPVNTGTAGNMVKMAHDEGVKVVGYDSMLVDGPLDVHVMQDSWAVGKLQGEAMIDWLKAKKGKVEGNVALIKGQPGDSNAIAMSSGAKEIIADNPGLKLVVEQSHEGWSPEKAMKTAENALSRYDNNIDAFICNNSGMARGVIAALKGEELADIKKVFVAGSDAALTNIRYVAQGIQAVEVFKKIKPLAERAAQTAVKLAENPDKSVEDVVDYDKMINNNFQDVPTIVTPIVKVTKDNIKETVIAAGFHTEESIYGE
ncbi:MAG: substrate-binding domain-containing protein [Fusobacteriota bacterium]